MKFNFNSYLINPNQLFDMNRRTRTKISILYPKQTADNVGTIEQKYGVDHGVRADMKLKTYLKKIGYDSLAKILKSK